MRELLTVLGYTFSEHARKKIFIVSTVIILVLTIAVLSIPAVIKAFEGKKDSGEQEKTKHTVLVVDAKGIFKEDLAGLSQLYKGYDFKAEPAEKTDSLKAQVKEDEKLSLLVIDEKEGVPYFDYWVKRYGNGLSPDSLSRNLKGIFAARLLKAANVPDTTAAVLLSDVSYKINELGKGMLKSYLSAMIVIMLLFFAIYFYGYWVSMSVASEKTSRVMELLLTSTKPSRIIIGKSIAMGLLGLLQFAAILATAAVTYQLIFPGDFKIDGQPLDFSSFTPLSVLMMIVYFILGYSLYAMMNAVAGATVSKAEDVNSAIMPISMISVLAFYSAYPTAAIPDGGMAIATSIIPFTAPFAMPCRLMMTEVPAWQIAASLVAMVITTVLMGWISIKLYSSAVLHYGKRLKIAELFRMSKHNAGSGN